MADKNVKIGIVTTADTSGADRAATAINRLTGVERERGLAQADLLTASEREIAEVERMVTSARKLIASREEEARAIKEVAEAAAQEQRELDVLEAKRRVAERTANSHAAATQNFGNVVTQVGYQVTDFTTQVSMGTNAFVAFAQQAPQAIGSIQQLGSGLKLSWNSVVGLGTGVGIIATSLAVGGQLVASEYAKMKAEIDKAKKSEEDYAALQVRIRQLEQERRDANRRGFIRSINKEDADDLERQVKALERINQLRAAQGGTATAEAQAAVVQAQNTPGGNVVGAQANVIAVGAENQADELKSRLTEFEAVFAQASQAVEAANRVWQDEAARGDQFGEAYINASNNLDAAIAAKAEAEKDLENQKALYDEGRRTLAANTAASIADLSAGVTADTKQSVSEFVDKAAANINAVVADRGPKLAADARGAIDSFNKLIGDEIPDAQQMDKIAAAVRQFRGSQSTMLAGLTSNFDALLTEANKLTGTIANQKSEIDRLRDRIEQLEQTK